MPLILRLSLAMLLAWTATPAHAACSLATAAGANLGTRTSYDVRAGAGGPLAVPVQLSCNGSVASILSADFARAAATSAGGFRLRSPAGDSIGYRLSADAAGQYGFASGQAINYLDPALLSLLGILNPAAFQPPMFVAVTETPNLPAGTYTDTVTVAWSWSICRLLGIGGICVLQDRDSGTTTLTVTMTVTRDCRIVAPALSFGTAPLAAQFAEVRQGVAVDCTQGTSYAVAFTAGSGGTARPWRQMRDGQGNVLRYNLYRPDGTTIWDETNPLPAAAPGTGQPVPTTLQTYVARIDPSQPTPPPGSYTDTVSVVVTF